MNIQQTLLIDLLNPQIQYRVPIYQRKYDWDTTDCKKFLLDIINAANDSNRPHHFVGSIIYKSEQSTTNIGAVNKYYLIDGQQRITTLSLLLWAIANYDTSYKKIILEDWLTNNSRHKNTDYYYKLRSIEDDYVAYDALLSGSPPPVGTTSKIFNNYNCMLNLLKKEKPHTEDIIDGISKLVIANISLDVTDNPQLIFETVNSSGKKLDDVDKVRNFILMNAGSQLQGQLYKNNWKPMENRLGKELNTFFRYYLTIKKKTKVPKEYYETFRDNYLGLTPQQIDAEVKDMDKYAKLYKKWKDANTQSKGTDLLLYNLKATGMDACLPIVLKLLKNVEEKTMSSNDADECLKIIEAFIIRREMCDYKSNTLGEAFLKMLIYSDSLANFKDCIKNKLTNKQKMPTDTELLNALKTRDFYHMKHCAYILNRIEKYLNPAFIPNHQEISIEHIMPQTIQSSAELQARSDLTQHEKNDRDWAKDLGANWKYIHETYCNTLGNLTLTGYNPQLGNCRFAIKRDKTSKAADGLIYGYKTSVIRLSQGLGVEKKWGENEILARLKTIVNNYISVLWPYVQ